MDVENNIHKEKGTDYVGSALLFALGVTFLFNNFGVIPWTVWPTIFKFWPVLLILAGVKMIFEASAISDFIIGVLSVLIIFYVFSYSISSVTPRFERWLKVNMPQVYKSFDFVPNQYQYKGSSTFDCLPFGEDCVYRFYR